MFMYFGIALLCCRCSLASLALQLRRHGQQQQHTTP